VYAIVAVFRRDGRDEKKSDEGLGFQSTEVLILKMVVVKGIEEEIS
jgi:hypothetical protein